MTDDEIKALCEGATGGPWVARSSEGPDRKAGSGELTSICRHVGDVSSEDHECVSYARGEDGAMASANGKFIAAARTLVPELLERAQRAESEVARLRAKLDAEDGAEVCEACPKPATKHDVDGVPLCDGCYAIAPDAETP